MPADMTIASLRGERRPCVGAEEYACIFHARYDGNEACEAGDFEEPADGRVAADDRDDAADVTDLADSGDERPEAGRIDRFGVRQVDDALARARFDEFRHRAREAFRGLCVETLADEDLIRRHHPTTSTLTTSSLVFDIHVHDYHTRASLVLAE